MAQASRRPETVRQPFGFVNRTPHRLVLLLATTAAALLLAVPLLRSAGHSDGDSMAELAAREKSRREQQGTHGKSYSDSDLNRYVPARPTDVDTPDSPMEQADNPDSIEQSEDRAGAGGATAPAASPADPVDDGATTSCEWRRNRDTGCWESVLVTRTDHGDVRYGEPCERPITPMTTYSEQERIACPCGDATGDWSACAEALPPPPTPTPTPAPTLELRDAVGKNAEYGEGTGAEIAPPVGPKAPFKTDEKRKGKIVGPEANDGN